VSKRIEEEYEEVVEKGEKERYSLHIQFVDAVSCERAKTGPNKGCNFP